MSSTRQQLHELREAVLAIAIDLGAVLGTNPETTAKLNTLAATPESPNAAKRSGFGEDHFAHMLADLDQIIDEMTRNFGQRSLADWLTMLRRAVDGEDYRR